NSQQSEKNFRGLAIHRAHRKGALFFYISGLHSKWLKELITKNNNLYLHNKKSINDYNHYVIKGHDVFIEVIAKDFKIEKINKENAGEYTRLIDEA
ncbi:hypothetical protein, partial [Neobacillus sp. NPDC093127]|uniref:hypothetical protein n=1 Tax=Neobacillus sp. NPDC093127 TaxID=3364296 RepID=UPI00382E4CC6